MARTGLMQMAPGRVVIQVTGLKELSRVMSVVALDDVPKILAAELRASGDPVKRKAESNARGHGLDSFASRMRISGGRSGIALSNPHPAAGVFDFAHPGALATVRQHTRAGHKVRAYTRTLNLPGSPNRAMFRAVDEELPGIEGAISAAVDRALQAYVDRPGGGA